MVLYVSVQPSDRDAYICAHIPSMQSLSPLHFYTQLLFYRFRANYVIGEMILNIAFDGILAINILW